MSVHKKYSAQKFLECAAMNADFILMESQFFHIIRMFSLRCCCCSHRVSHARAVYKLGLFVEQYQFLLLMLVLLIRYSDNRKNQLTWKVPSGVNGSGKKTSFSKRKVIHRFIQSNPPFVLGVTWVQFSIFLHTLFALWILPFARFLFSLFYSWSKLNVIKFVWERCEKPVYSLSSILEFCIHWTMNSQNWREKKRTIQPRRQHIQSTQKQIEHIISATRANKMCLYLVKRCVR